MKSVPQAVGNLDVTSEMPEATHVESDMNIAGDLARLTELVEADAVEEARAFARELIVRWPDSDRVRHWAHVLEPPRSRVERGASERALHQERAWLHEHAHDYPGCWLAVYHDQLIAAGPDLHAVLAATRRSIGSESALLHFQPNISEPE